MRGRNWRSQFPGAGRPRGRASAGAALAARSAEPSSQKEQAERLRLLRRSTSLRRMRSWVSAFVACSLVACGPKPEAKGPPPKPVEVAPLAVAEDPPDLSPVAKPAEIVV